MSARLFIATLSAMSIGRFTFLSMVATLLFSGCSPAPPPGMKEQRVQVSPEFFKTYPALGSVNRWKMAFPQLPSNGTVRILTVDRANWKPEVPPPNYDVQFQFITGSADFPYTEHNVFLAQTNGAQQWVREQMTFYGPKHFVAEGAQINESITLAREADQSPSPGIINLAGTTVTYSGSDSRLAQGGTFTGGLNIFQVGPILREWGYKYDADVNRPRPPSMAPPRPTTSHG